MDESVLPCPMVSVDVTAVAARVFVILFTLMVPPYSIILMPQILISAKIQNYYPHLPSSEFKPR